MFQKEANKILEKLFKPYIEYNNLIAICLYDIEQEYKGFDTSDIYKEIDDRSNIFYESLPKSLTGSGRPNYKNYTSYNKEMRDFVRTYDKKRNL